MDQYTRATVVVFMLGMLSLPQPPVTEACSMVEGYSPPTNYEITRDADAIVLARSIRFSELGDGMSLVVFKVHEVLKGQVDSSVIEALGYREFHGAGDEQDFSQPRPGAYRGDCVATDFRFGREYLLFLQLRGGYWSIDGPSFTRVSEEVSGPDSPWVQAVRLYVRLSALQDYEAEKEALTRLAALDGKQLANRVIPQPLIEDAQRHLKTPSYMKSLPDLLVMLEKAENQNIKEKILWAIAWKGTDDATSFLEDLVARPEGERHQQKLAIHLSLKHRFRRPRASTE